MKKLITMFTIMIMSLLGLVSVSKPSYAYYEFQTMPTTVDYTITYNGYYPFDAPYDEEICYVFAINFTTPFTNGTMHNLSFKQPFITDKMRMVNVSSLQTNDNRIISPYSYVFDTEGTQSVTGDYSNNVWFWNYEGNISTIYLHIWGGPNLLSSNAPAFATALQNATQITPGNISIFLNNVKNYTAGYDQGQDDLFTEGSATHGYVLEDSFDYIDGYADGYADGYDVGENDLYTNGSVAQGLAPSGSYDVSYGYGLGQNDMYENGSSLYGFVQSTSQDYADGYSEGQEAGLSTHYADFMSGFEKWIVPAILIILILGGTLAMRKRKEGE